MKDIPTSLLTLVAGVLVTLVSLWYGQHHGLMPEQASVQAPLVDGLFNLMVTISTALIIVVLGAMLIFVVKFRCPPGDESDGLPIEGNLPLEAFWTAVPAIIIIILAIYTVEIFQEMGGFNPGDHAGHHMSQMAQHPAAATIAQSTVNDTGDALVNPTPEAAGNKLPVFGYGASPQQEGKPASLMVDVKGMQYAWIFTYPDSGIVTGELHIPIGQDIQLNLSAQDVIHSFWVPQFRLKQDAIPGERTELRFTASKVGEYPVVCAELCGSYHGSMRTKVIVHAPDDYSQWVQQSKVAQLTDGQAAIALAPDLPSNMKHRHHSVAHP